MLSERIVIQRWENSLFNKFLNWSLELHAHKIWGVLEDPGCLLTQAGAEAGEVQMVYLHFP